MAYLVKDMPQGGYRSRPVDPVGFRVFNQKYAEVLRRWGIADGEDNPVARSGAARNGLTRHACRPPVLDVEFEMDCRAIGMEGCLVV